MTHRLCNNGWFALAIVALAVVAGPARDASAQRAHPAPQPGANAAGEREAVPQEELVTYASRGTALSAGFQLGWARADVIGATNFSRNWFAVNVGLPMAGPLVLDWMFSLEYSFQVALDVDDGFGLRPVQLSAEFEFFWPLDPEATNELSLFASVGIGWQYFDFDDVGARNFVHTNVHVGGRFYFDFGTFFQVGFAYQRASGFGTGAVDIDYWNFSLMLGIRFA